jgi:hypothetical protein
MYIWISTLVKPGTLPLEFARRIPWTWYVTIGACLTFAVGYLASLAMKTESEANVSRKAISN